MYQVTREVEFGDLKVTVKELTVAEVRRWMNEAKPEQDDKEFDMFLDLLSFDGIGIDEIYLFTDLKKEQVSELPPSVLQKLAAVIKELNSVFFNQYLPTLTKLRERVESDKSSSAASAG
jgi:hypothetical protein